MADIAAVLLSVCLYLSPALAQQLPPEEARAYKQHVAQATEHFRAGRYDQSIAEYEAAYDIRQNSSLLFNIANAHRRAGRLEDALATYTRLLAVDPDTSFKAEARGYIAELRTKLELQKDARRAAAPAAGPVAVPQPGLPAGPAAPDLQSVQAALGPQVPVELAAGDRDHRYRIRLIHSKLEQARANHLSRECETPCAVDTYAGENMVYVKGEAAFYRLVTIPSHPATVEIRQGQRRTRLAGIGLVGTGATLALLGACFLPLIPIDNGISGGAMLGAGALFSIVGGILWGTARLDSITVRDNLRASAR